MGGDEVNDRYLRPGGSQNVSTAPNGWTPRYLVTKAPGVDGPPIPENAPCLVIREQDRLAAVELDVSHPRWHASAPCNGLTALFFLDKGNPAGIETARAICAGCPYRARCLEENLYEHHGFVGGTTERERRVIRRQRRNERRPPEHGTRSRYGSYRCRCVACTAANTAYLRLKRARAS